MLASTAHVLTEVNAKLAETTLSVYVPIHILALFARFVSIFLLTNYVNNQTQLI